MDVDNIPYISFLYQENYNFRGEMDYFFHGVTFQVKTKIGHLGNSASQVLGVGEAYKNVCVKL